MKILAVLDQVFSILGPFVPQMAIIGQIIAGGKDLWDQVHAELPDEDVTLEQIYAKWQELRQPIDFTPDEPEPEFPLPEDES